MSLKIIQKLTSTLKTKINKIFNMVKSLKIKKIFKKIKNRFNLTYKILELKMSNKALEMISKL